MLSRISGGSVVARSIIRVKTKRRDKAALQTNMNKCNESTMHRSSTKSSAASAKHTWVSSSKRSVIGHAQVLRRTLRHALL